MAQARQARPKPDRAAQGASQAARPEAQRPAGSGGVTAPFWEKVVGAVGLVIVLGMLGFLVYQALEPQNPPDISVAAHEITRLGQGFLVQMRASNHGDLAAASVVIEATLHASNAATGDAPVESGEVTFDFVPAGSTRQGGIIFQNNPDDYVLGFQVKSFVDP